MYIQEITIENYKSFASAQIIHFSKGINLVVGKNNVGKTALLEALTFSSNNPHISDKSKPRRTINNQKNSIFEGKFVFSRQEFEDYVSDHNDSIFFLGDEADEHIYRFFEDPRQYGWYKMARNTDFEFYYDMGTEPGEEPWWHEINYNEIELFQAKLNTYFNNELVIHYIIDENGRQFAFEGLYLSKKNWKDPVQYKFILRNDKIEGDWEYKSKEGKDIGLLLLDYSLANKIYKFDIHRRVGSNFGITKKMELTPDCGNLPGVLLVFQSDSVSFGEYKKAIKEIFPEIYDVIISPNDSGEAEIRIWNTSPIKDRTDLAIPLKDCGTGIGQVLAILYLVISSASPQVIIIDEPNSFLHPSASRKLMNIFKRYPQHQYIISTHSPEIIASNPDNLILLTLENGETKVKVLETNQKQDIQYGMREIGLKLSDVYGFDSILWVEGPTEQVCFPKIISKLFPMLDENIAFEAVRNTGDFGKKYLETTFALYQKLSGDESFLIPPAVAYIFDREGKKDSYIQELEKMGKGKIHFINPRLYENFILDNEAIAFLLNQYSTKHEWGREYSITEIVDWIEAHKTSKEYWDNRQPSEKDQDDWKNKIHAANLLGDLFNELSESRLPYKEHKPIYSLELTEYLIEHKPEAFDLLKELFNRILPNIEPPTS
jgi:predicted ATPase